MKTWKTHLGLTIGLLLPLLARAERVGPRLDLGPEFYRLSNAHVTEHVAWARPLPGGPIRVLFLVPRYAAREAVELTQRVDLDFDAVLFFAPGALAHPRARADLVGAAEEDVTALLKEKLEQPWDVIVLGRVHYEAIPDWARGRIEEKVRAGTALLSVFPDASTRVAWEKNESLPLPDFSASLPVDLAPPFAGRSDPSVVLNEALALYRSGEGRVALLDWPGLRPWRLSALTPDLPMPVYEYHQALLARVLLHLAGRDPVDLDLRVDDQRVSVVLPPLAGDAAAHVVEIRLRDPENVVTWTRLLPLREEEASWRAEALLPILPDGPHTLEARLLRDGLALGWACTGLERRAPVRIGELTLDAESFEAHDDVTGTVTLESPPRSGDRLRIAVEDNWGRRTAARERPAPEDPPAQDFAIPSGASLTRLNYLVAELVDAKGRLLDRRRLEFGIPDRDPPDDFLLVGWGGGHDAHHTQKLAGEQLRDLGLDVFSGGGFNREGVRGPARLNLMKIPYAWRVAAHYHRHVTNHVRHPCLNDPEYIAEQQEIFVEKTRECDLYGVPAYHLGDENYYMLYDPHRGLGACYSSACQDSFREFLRGEYGTIEALNAQWETDFASWEAVAFSGPDDLPRRNEAPRFDFLRHLELTFRRAHHMALEAIQSVDPTARVGLEGLESLDASWGVDWYRLLEPFRLQNVYPYVDWTVKDLNRHAVRSFASPGTLTGMWYGGYISHRYETFQRWFPWYSLFLGFNSAWWYDVGQPGEMYNALGPDLSPLETYRQTVEEIAEIKRGVGRLTMACERVGDPVALHYSYRSLIMDNLKRPPIYERKDGPYAKAVSAFINVLEDLGLSFNMMATEEIEAGALIERGYKVLIMPSIEVLTDREFEQIRAFVGEGGMILADWKTGIRDAHGVPRESFPMDELFGIDRSGHIDVFRGRIRLDASAGGIDGDLFLPDGEIELFGAATTAEALGAQVVAFKAGMVNAYGEGKAVYLNFPLETYVADRLRGHSGPQREFFRRVLAAGGVEAPLRVDNRGQPLEGARLARFRQGGLELVYLYRDFYLEDKGPAEGWLRLDREAFVYDVRAQRLLDRTDRVYRTLHPGRMHVLALLPYRVERLRAEPPAPARRGDTVRVSFEVETSGPEPDLHVLHVTVRGPDGVERPHYRRNLTAPAGRAAFELPLALNDPPGRWIIEATDVVSGARHSAYVTVSMP